MRLLSLQGGEALGVRDFMDDYQTYVETPGHRFAITHDFDVVAFRTYDALIVPGNR